MRPSVLGSDGTTSTRTAPARAPSPAATARTRPTFGAASRARCSKSSVVTARPRVRRRIGPRTLAFSMSSPSMPPRASFRFSTVDTTGIADLSTVSARAATLPAAPPPVRYSSTRMKRSLPGVAPYRRRLPSGWRIAGPNRISPFVPSTMKWRSSGPLAAKSSTCVQSSHAGAPPVPLPPETASLAGSSVDSTGFWRTSKRWPVVPSETPTSSFRTTYALTAAAVPPTVIELAALTVGDASYPDIPGSGSTIRARTHAASRVPIECATCPRGTWMTTSPSRLRPPVESESRSHGSHSSPFHASHLSGGWSGLTPTPSMSHLKRSRMAFDGTGLDSPISIASPSCGRSWKQNASLPSSTCGSMSR